MVEVLDNVMLAYKLYYYIERKLPKPRQFRLCGCSPETGDWPNNYETDGESRIPTVCEAHEWLHRRAELQTRVNGCDLANPVPATAIGALGAWGKELKSLDLVTHPLDREPLIHRVAGTGSTARLIAHYLTQPQIAENEYSMSHVVWFLDHSMVLSGFYNGREANFRAILANAPVLVYFWNSDGRPTNPLPLTLIYGRPHGIALIIKE